MQRWSRVGQKVCKRYRESVAFIRRRVEHGNDDISDTAELRDIVKACLVCMPSLKRF